MPGGEILHQQRIVTVAERDADGMGARGTQFEAVCGGGDAGLRQRDRDRDAHFREIELAAAQAVGDVVVAEAVVEGEGIDADAALLHVGARTAIQPVVAAAGSQRIVAGATQQGVIATAGGDLVVAGAAVQLPVAGLGRGRHLALVDVDQIVAGTAGQRAAAGAADQRVLAVAGLDVNRHVLQARSVEQVVAGAEIGDHRGHATEGLVVAVVFNAYRAAGAVQREGLVAVRGVEVQPVGRERAGVQGQHAASLLRQHGLDIRCGQIQVEQVDPEQFLVEDGVAEQVDEDAADEIRSHVDVEQVLEAATLVVVQGDDIAGAHLAIGLPGHIGDIAEVVLGQDREGDVVQVQRSEEIDAGFQPTRHRADIDAGAQLDLRVDGDLRRLLAAGAGHDLALGEGGQRDVVHEEAVEHVDRVAGCDRLADAVGVEPHRQIRRRAELGRGAEQEVERRDDRDQDIDRLGHLGAEQRELVAEQRGIAAGQQLLPVVDVLDVGEELEAAPWRSALRLAAFRRQQRAGDAVQFAGQPGRQIDARELRDRAGGVGGVFQVLVRNALCLHRRGAVGRALQRRVLQDRDDLVHDRRVQPRGLDVVGTEALDVAEQDSAGVSPALHLRR